MNVDTFIICVGFELTNVDTIRTLTRYEHDPWTRIATPTLYHQDGTCRPICMLVEMIHRMHIFACFFSDYVEEPIKRFP